MTAQDRAISRLAFEAGAVLDGMRRVSGCAKGDATAMDGEPDTIAADHGTDGRPAGTADSGNANGGNGANGPSGANGAPAAGAGGLDPKWQIAIQAVRSAAARIREYEDAFDQISVESSSLVDDVERERAALYDRIDALEARIAELEGRNEETAGLLHDRQLECWSLKVRLSAIEENLVVAEQDIRRSARFIAEIERRMELGPRPKTAAPPRPPADQK